MERMIALLRAVNVGGRKLPMAELRALCAKLGWKDVATYVQSGNIVFTASAKAIALEAELEGEIAQRFRIKVPVVVRTARQWTELATSNPFPEAARNAPSRLLLLVSKQPPHHDAADRLTERAEAGERVRLIGGALWVRHAAGIGTSKLTPSLIGKACGSPATGRNYRTVAKLLEMVSE